MHDSIAGRGSVNEAARAQKRIRPESAVAARKPRGQLSVRDCPSLKPIVPLQQDRSDKCGEHNRPLRSAHPQMSDQRVRARQVSASA
jgi:hypothetical protein